VMVTAGGPHYGPLLQMDSAQVRQAISEHVVLALEVARNAVGKMRPGGTLLLMGGTGGRRVGRGLGIVSAGTAALPPFTAALALELAPVRVNLIAAGFVDTPFRPRCSEINWRSAATSCGRRSRSAVSSSPPTSPRSPSS
ncbi:SDR family oxidoreductase, partial [Nonomuraea sp. RK-328]|nr:SDR family oxidoreductase [Nonomuraea sp. RK-328]